MKIQTDDLDIKTQEDDLRAYNFPLIGKTIYATSFEEAKKILLNQKTK